MLLKFKVNNINIFQSLMQIIGNTVDEVNFECCPKKIKITSLDDKLIALFNIILPKKWFLMYQCAKSYKLGIDLIVLNSVLSGLNDRHILSIIHNTKRKFLTLLVESKGLLYFFILYIINYNYKYIQMMTVL